MINSNIRSTQIDNNVTSKTKAIQCDCDEIQKQFDIRLKKNRYYITHLQSFCQNIRE